MSGMPIALTTAKENEKIIIKEIKGGKRK